MKRLMLLMFAAAALSACGSTLDEERLGCPGFAILAEGSRLNVFRSGSESDGDLLYRGELGRAQSKCTAEPTQASVDGSFTITIIRGPAMESGAVSVPYFVSVTQVNRNVMWKQTYEREITLPAGQNEVTVVQEVDDIDFTMTPETVPPDYEVVVGFQLTREQLAYNRAHYRF